MMYKVLFLCSTGIQSDKMILDSEKSCQVIKSSQSLAANDQNVLTFLLLQRLVLCPTTNHHWAPAPPAKSTNPIKLSYEFCCHLPMWAELPVSNIVLNNCQTAANLTHKLLISCPIIHADFQTSNSWNLRTTPYFCWGWMFLTHDPKVDKTERKSDGFWKSTTSTLSEMQMSVSSQ